MADQDIAALVDAVFGACACNVLALRDGGDMRCLRCRLEPRLATAVLALTEERDLMRRTLSSVRASIRLVCNRDKINEWTADTLRETEREIDAALRGKEESR